MTNQHLIIPPRELLDKWFNLPMSTQEIFVVAAQWGADQELKACVGWLDRNGYFDSAHDLGAARRSKPPSLKEQGLTALKLLKQRTTDPNIIEPLSQAVEQLDD